MTPNKQLSGRPILNWLGLGILVIVTVGIILLSRGPTKSDEPSDTTPLRALSRDHSTPVSADESSPLTAAVRSPLPSPGVLPDTRVPAVVPVPDTTTAPTPSGSLLPPPVPGADLQFSLLHSNDTWGYVLPCGWRPPLGGVARRASIIHQQRELGGFVLVLDAGNGLMGDQDPAKRTLGQASIEAMNMMGYDAAALGPNDLALGENALRQRIDEAQFPILSANAAISAEDELLTTPYVLRQFGGHTIAVIGLSGGDGTQEITVRDPLEAARRTVAEIGRQADVIILLSSAGQEKNIQIAESVPDIDLIISAATSELTSPWQADKTGTLVLLADNSSPGHAGRRIGVAHLAFDAEGRLVGQEWQRLSLGPEVPADPAMAKWVGEQTTP